MAAMYNSNTIKREKLLREIIAHQGDNTLHCI